MARAVQAMEPYAPYRFTVEEYYRMADAHILSEDDRVEIAVGDVVHPIPES